jgi:hypothetical protein
MHQAIDEAPAVSETVKKMLRDMERFLSEAVYVPPAPTKCQACGSKLVRTSRDFQLCMSCPDGKLIPR